MTLSAAMGMFGLNQANAEYDPNLKSIDTPPADSNIGMIEKGVKTQQKQ